MKSKTQKVDKTSDSVSFLVGLVGLVVVLGAGIFVPLKLAEVMFGYSLSDAFWNASQTAEFNENETDVQRSRR